MIDIILTPHNQFQSTQQNILINSIMPVAYYEFFQCFGVAMQSNINKSCKLRQLKISIM